MRGSRLLSLAPLTQKGPFWIKRGFSHVREPKYRCHATQEEVSLTKQPSRSVRGSILRIVATLYKKRSHCPKKRSHCPTHYNTLQHAATRCNTLQHAATHCTTVSIRRCHHILEKVCCMSSGLVYLSLQCVVVCFAVATMRRLKKRLLSYRVHVRGLVIVTTLYKKRCVVCRVV